MIIFAFYNVREYYLATFLNQSPIFEWCGARHESKNKQYTNTCLKKDWIGLPNFDN